MQVPIAGCCLYHRRMAYHVLKASIPILVKGRNRSQGPGSWAAKLRYCVGAAVTLKRNLTLQSNMETSKHKGVDGEASAVTLFREYLRIKTVHPDPDYDAAVVFLNRVAKEIGLEFHCVEVHPRKPVVVLKWKGTDETLPTILLNSHTDVVPVYQEFWKYDPFAAVKEENGDIYARGTQDMKSVGIQYLEAIRRLEAEGKSFPRTIYLSFMPDEEVGGKLGMQKFLESQDFKDMNVGFGLDEGLANPTEEFKVYYGQRSTWWLKITCPGNPGHGSRFIENIAVEKVQKIVNQIMEYRNSEKSRLEKGSCLHLGDVTTCNINLIQGGGMQLNVVPSEFIVGVDIRISHDNELKDFEERIQTWVRNAGSDVTYEFVQKSDSEEVTSTETGNPWWEAFSQACTKMNMKIDKEVFPAGTDSRYLRKIGTPCLGFSPMNNTPILLHDNNEFLNENIFLKGIDIYYEIISSLARVPKM
ncbi:aminoacylase-1-like [Rhopilema esculentum]|uniref:aminoacylase-1-like n=1 Tax=Rhopilema esculentum TaxID=499914 RepID=UPI0031D96AA7